MTIVRAVVPREVARRLARGDEVVGGHAVFCVRQFDVVDGGSRRLEHGVGFVHALAHLRVETLRVVFRHAADLQPRERLLEQFAVARHLGGERRRVARVVAGDRLEHEGAVGGRAGHRADLVEARRKRHEPAPADPAVGRLEPRDAAQAGWLTDRAARVGADGHGGHVGRHARGRAAARSAWCPREIPGVFHRAEGGVFIGAAHRELVHVRLADDHGIGGPQPGHGVGVVRRAEAGEHLGGACRGQIASAEGVFDRHGQARERPERLAGLAPCVDSGCGRERPFAVDLQKRVDRAVEPGGPIEEGLGALHRRHVALPDGGHDLDGGKFGGLHGCEDGSGRA